MVVMPSKVCTMSSTSTDPRSLNNLSMELSMLHLPQRQGHTNGLSAHIERYDDSFYQQHDFIQQDRNSFGANKLQSNVQSDMGFDETIMSSMMSMNRPSSNMTETVPVPSSEHVAEIVGRQGCKIKSLRAKTNTYIKTPVRGAEPVFVVTGRQEDVAQAKREILSAADHFSQIRASRRSGSSQTSNSGSASPTSIPGHTTKEVRVPYQLVGLVVGPKGATIKRIQQTTSTYIVTPGRDKEPVFEVTGLPENVEKAKEEIENHITSRTGSDNNSDLHIDNFHIGMDSGYDKSRDPTTNGRDFHGFNGVINMNDNLPPLSSIVSKSNHFPIGSSAMSQCNTTMSNGTGKKFNNENGIYNPFQGQYSSFNQVAEIDEGIGASGMNLFDPSSIWSDSCYMSQPQRSNSLSVHHLPPGEDGPHPRTRRTNSDPLAKALQQATISRSPTSSHGSNSPSVANRRSGSPGGTCMMCRSQANACLQPCHHSSFCLPCAHEICQREPERRRCPICGSVPQRAVHL